MRQGRQIANRRENYAYRHHDKTAQTDRETLFKIDEPPLRRDVRASGNLCYRRSGGTRLFRGKPAGLKLIDKVEGLEHAELERLLGLPVQA